MDPIFYTESRLKTLKGRAERCCCKYCGGRLEIRQIVFNHYEEARLEIFCIDCNRIEYGVEQDIYNSACYFVDQLHYTEWPQIQFDHQYRSMNIAKVCDILSWGARQWGILSQDGFTIPIAKANYAMHSCMILEDDDLNE